jgi:hypothetical protein
MTRLITIVELRGLEPPRFAAKMPSELRRLFFAVVTRMRSVLRICLGVLRDVTVVTAPTVELIQTLAVPTGAKSIRHRIGIEPGTRLG